jgi:hypothetical protein
MKALSIALFAIILAHQQYPIASCILTLETAQVKAQDAAKKCFKQYAARKVANK